MARTHATATMTSVQSCEGSHSESTNGIDTTSQNDQEAEAWPDDADDRAGEDNGVGSDKRTFTTPARFTDRVAVIWTSAPSRLCHVAKLVFVFSQVALYTSSPLSRFVEINV